MLQIKPTILAAFWVFICFPIAIFAQFENGQVRIAQSDSSNPGNNALVTETNTETSDMQVEDATPSLRSITILDLVNSQKLPDFEYLSSTIADVLETALKQTNSFRIIPHDTTMKRVNELGITQDSLFDTSVAARIGVEMESDVVIMGKFVKVQDDLLISIRAISPIDQRTYCEEEIIGDASDPFGLVDALVIDMQVSMVTALPEIQALVEVRTETETIVETHEIIIERTIRVPMKRPITYPERTYAMLLENRYLNKRKNLLFLGLSAALPYLAMIYPLANTFDDIEDRFWGFGILIALGSAAGTSLPIIFGKPAVTKKLELMYHTYLPQFDVNDPSLTSNLLKIDALYRTHNVFQSYYTKYQKHDKKAKRAHVINMLIWDISAVGSVVASSIAFDMYLDEIFTFGIFPTVVLCGSGTGAAIVNAKKPRKQTLFLQNITDDTAGTLAAQALNKPEVSMKEYILYHHLKARHEYSRRSGLFTRPFVNGLITTVSSTIGFIGGLTQFGDSDDEMVVMGNIVSGTSLPLMLSGITALAGKNLDGEPVRAFPYYAIFSGMFFSAFNDEFDIYYLRPVRGWMIAGSMLFLLGGMGNSALSFIETDYFPEVEAGTMTLDEAMEKIAKKAKLTRFVNGSMLHAFGASCMVLGPVLAYGAGLQMHTDVQPYFTLGGIGTGLLFVGFGLTAMLVKSEIESLIEFLDTTEKNVQDLQSLRSSEESKSMRIFVSPYGRRGIAGGLSIQF